MKICVIGTGYVGLVAGTCLAEMGNEVICIDSDNAKLEKLQKGIVPIYEPGLEELIQSNVNEGRLIFSNDLKLAVKKSLICFIAVGTPLSDSGSADLSSVFSVAEDIARYMNNYKVIVNKSTVPVGTGEKIHKIIKNITDFEFDIVSNPEFLKQGAAVEDFLKPDRIILGVDSKKALDIMNELYAPFLRTGNPIIVMDIKSAEMSKYASNSFLATKISFINEIANICEKVGADIDMVRLGMCADSRIGSKFLFPGLGYGGSCFPKDIKALIQTATEYDCECKILKGTDFINIMQRKVFIDKILKKFKYDISGKKIAVWGLAFKPKTNDMRDAPSIDIINALLSEGASVTAYDPKAMSNAKKIFNDKIVFAQNAYDAIKGADALLLLTEWNEFRHPDFEKIKSLLNNTLIIDGRNQYNKKQLNLLGIEYICIGKK